MHQYQYPTGCPCGRKGTSKRPCPGRICRYYNDMQWHLYSNLYPDEADYLFKRVAEGHAQYVREVQRLEANANAKPETTAYMRWQ